MMMQIVRKRIFNWVLVFLMTILLPPDKSIEAMDLLEITLTTLEQIMPYQKIENMGSDK
jgi:hypothetical protein